MKFIKYSLVLCVLVAGCASHPRDSGNIAVQPAPAILTFPK